ncbi:Peptidase S1 domain-containing protein [Trichostrongylus colubriformis]|uniref:Peptidase S1 domain-containing protein n=1 Tax=Trichostrongylus colubriformis TaxID=6319 RepID=A0AAN8IDL2_TRICO
MQLLVLLCLFLLPREISTRKLTKEENIMLKKECGAHHLNHSTGYHVLSMGGEEVEPNTLPWITALFRITANGGMYHCSAVQISQRHILTAAHCILGDKLDNIQRETVCELLRRVNMNPVSVPHLFLKPFKHIEVYATSSHTGRLHYRDRDRWYKMEIEGHPYVHQGYDPCTFDNDLAVIELKNNVPYGVGSPICMGENEKLADMLTSAGYGKDPEYPDATVESHWLQKVNFDSRDVTESATKITASVYGKSICPGDSGGPLFQLNHENKYALVGIASTVGKRCNEKVNEGEKRRSMFTNVRNYRNWICRYTGVCPIQQTESCQDCGDSIENWIEIFIGAKKVPLTERN